MIPETNSLLINLSRKQDSASDTAAFARDIANGLGQYPKTLPSRYFYDGNGSRLFQQIMHLPEYYLTRCEHEVLTKHNLKIVRNFAESGFFHLIDLGAGDALKTKILLRALDKQQLKEFEYIPVDISGDAMQQLTAELQQELPEIQVQAVVGEYFEAMKWLQINKTQRKVVLFLGSNIGNFEKQESIDFLKNLHHHLSPGDKLLMGADMRKAPATIQQAYSDASGITAAFNLNLLRRINSELGGCFNLKSFHHYALYDPQEGVMKSYLISEKEQEVYIKALNRSFKFEAWEAVHTEDSRKYSLSEIEALGKKCGFKTDVVFQDEAQQFADVLLTVI